MGRNLEQVIAALPAARRRKIEARTAELVAEVEGLKALRRLAERSQEQIAASLGIKQPSVHKIEKQADLYLSTLRRFIEAAGGSLELLVELPGLGQIRLTGVGEIGGAALPADERKNDGAEVRAVAEERQPYRGGKGDER